MVERMAVGFLAAAVLTLGAGAWLRVQARSRGWLRQVGGVCLAIAAPVGVVVAPDVTSRAVALALLAVGLAAVGFLQAQHVLPRWLVPLAVVAAGVGGAATGIRFHLIGVPAVDAAWTVAWLVAVTLAVAGLGNADGLTAGIVSAAGVGVMALAGFADQGAAAAAAAALVGAALAFLAYNLRPASLYIGRTGGLFVGFSLAAGALWLEPAIGRPDALVVPLFIVGVALLDGTMVVLSRLRHRRKLSTRYRDHLAHRLVAVGLRPSQAISALVAVQVVMSALAVFVGRGVLSLPVGGGAGLLVLGVLWVVSMRATVSSEDAPGFSYKVWLVGLGVVLLLGAASAGAGYLAYESRDDVTAGRDFARDALRAARAGEPNRAAVLFAKAEDAFASARDKVDSPLATPGLLVPVVGANLNAARELSDIGAELARAGQQLTASVDPDSLRIVDGRVPLEAVAEVEPKLTEAADILVDSKDRLDDLDRTYLVDQIDEAITKLEPELAKTTEDAVHGAAAARLAPKILGGDGPRRYFLAVQNPAELRGTGGLIGNWAILTAEDGKVSVEDVTKLGVLNYKDGDPKRVLHAPADYKRRYARYKPETEWHTVNISPDFPTVGAVIGDLFPQSGGTPVDGVIAVDPVGLAALLELTGPVELASWPDPITSKNVVDVTLRDAYNVFAENSADRKDFLGDVAETVVDKATSGDLGRPAKVGKVLGQAAHEGHFSLYFARPSEEDVAHELNVSGGVPTTDRDSLLVLEVNGAGNKLDYYLDRTIDYSVEVTPDSDLRAADVSGTVQVSLTNTAPPTGLPNTVAGPAEGTGDRFVEGQNRALVSVYTPLDAGTATVDGQTVGLERDLELGRRVYSAAIDVFAQQARSFSVDVEGRVRLAPKGWYELELVKQPTLEAEPVHVKISVPKGFEAVAATGGLHLVDGGAEGTVTLDRTRTVRVRLAHTGGRSLWDRLVDGP